MKKWKSEIKSTHVLWVLFIGFSLICIVGIITTVESHPEGFAYFFNDFRIGELVIGLGTVLLAIFTAYLAFSEINENRENRNLTRIEGAKERRRLRLKEQLEGLYSPLMADIDNFDNFDEHDISFSRDSYGNLQKENEAYICKTMQTIRSKYKFLAKPQLKEQLKDYYIMDINGRYGIEKINEFKELLPKLKEIIKQEYNELSDEYEELVMVK